MMQNVHSCFTRYSTIAMEGDTALNYLYFNGHCPLDSTQHEFARRVQFSTICQHIRAAHSFTYNAWPVYTKAILYAISDSKAIFNHLRACKDDMEFSKAWVPTKIVPWNPNEKEVDLDGGNNKKLGKTTDDQLRLAWEQLSMCDNRDPIAYRNLRFMFSAARDVALHCHYSYLEHVLLKICSMRMRMDERVKWYEQRNQ